MKNKTLGISCFDTFKFANFRLKFFKTVFYTIARGKGVCVGVFVFNTKESYTCNALCLLVCGARRQISTRTLRRSVAGGGCYGCGTGGRESVLEG